MNPLNPSALVVLSLLAFSLLLAGCLQSQEPADENGNGPGMMVRDSPGFDGSNGGPMMNGNGSRFFNRSGNFSGRGFGNLTEAQRQALAQQFRVAAQQACNGKSEGSFCEIDSGASMGPRGLRNGTCKLLNESLECQPEFSQRRPMLPSN